jgi:hypothetical protein
MKPLSMRTHTIIGLAVGAALIVAPWLFAFVDEGGAAVRVPIYLGIFILLSELTTTSPISPLKWVPMKTHIAIDILTGLFLLTSPWLFDFADLETNAWVPHVVVGAVIVAYALMTRTSDDSLSQARP